MIIETFFTEIDKIQYILRKSDLRKVKMCGN